MCSGGADLVCLNYSIALSPASLELAAISSQIISLLRSPTADPNYLFVTAVSPAEVAAKPSAKIYLENRQRAIETHISSPNLSPKTTAFLKSVGDLNGLRLAVYQGKASAQDRDAFFAQSKETWTTQIRNTLDTLESLIGGGGESATAGPYTLGDQLSLADLHLMAWLANIVFLAGGQKEKEGIDALETKIGGGWKVGEKLGAFWDASLLRPSFNKVYAAGLH